MKEDFASCPTIVAALRRHRWVCLLVAFFLLYNPFLATPRAASGLEVCHPASHRATTGASELQHFSPAAGWDFLLSLDIAGVEVPVSLPALVPAGFVLAPLVASLPQQFSGASLRLRSPPAL